jgi:hypothetical protein
VGDRLLARHRLGISPARQAAAARRAAKKVTLGPAIVRYIAVVGLLFFALGMFYHLVIRLVGPLGTRP